ncbi:MAG TPA: hypothetical protein PK668_19845 [Myxococcota bacterium]|nr:hypothetical protein [Myxococcota bacterium]HRY95012.1 hypothetical protein [Myxococcota bacterium]HSA21618.1 hypothetical protein [Myxococcota bacterium]
MRTHLTAVWLAAALVASGASAGAPPEPKEQAVAANCEQAWVISRGDSPWQGYTSSAEEESAGKHIQAVPLRPDFEVPKHLSRYVSGGKPLLAIDRKARRVHVEAAYFGDLERPDATRLGKGAQASLGTLKKLPAGLSHADLARFLVESQLVQTYWHLEARLCPGSVQDDAGAYRIELRGTHSYCTNRCQDDPVEFAVRLDKQTGAMTIEGL